MNLDLKNTDSQFAPPSVVRYVLLKSEWWDRNYFPKLFELHKISWYGTLVNSKGGDSRADDYSNIKQTELYS